MVNHYVIVRKKIVVKDIDLKDQVRLPVAVAVEQATEVLHGTSHPISEDLYLLHPVQA